MLNDQLETFTDRREAITLFNSLRGRDPDKPWPLLPMPSTKPRVQPRRVSAWPTGPSIGVSALPKR